MDLQLWVGLASTIMLLFVSLILTGPILSSENIDTTGLLQLAWLVGQEPGITERVAGVDEPMQDNLRRADQFEVNMGESGREH